MDHCLRVLTSSWGEFSDEAGKINFQPELKEVESILWCEREPSFVVFHSPKGTVGHYEQKF